MTTISIISRIMGMNYIDLTNAIFEGGGGIFALINVIQLLKDKSVKGVNIGSAIFFTVWSIWAIIFYYKTNNFYSMGASVLIAIMEVLWVGLWFKYRKRKE